MDYDRHGKKIKDTLVLYLLSKAELPLVLRFGSTYVSFQGHIYFTKRNNVLPIVFYVPWKYLSFFSRVNLSLFPSSFDANKFTNFHLFISLAQKLLRFPGGARPTIAELFIRWMLEKKCKNIRENVIKKFCTRRTGNCFVPKTGYIL